MIDHPLWAIYNCGSDINGEIDIYGTYHYFTFKYHRQADRIITGKFGLLKMSKKCWQSRCSGGVLINESYLIERIKNGY